MDFYLLIDDTFVCNFFKNWILFRFFDKRTALFNEKWILFTFLSMRPVRLFDESWILLRFCYFHHKVESIS